MESVPGRSKYFFLWPSFNSEKDAKDIAKAGTLACALIAASSAFIFIGQESGVLIALVLVLVWGFLGYYTLKLNRVITTISFSLFAMEKLYSLYASGKSPGIGIILALYLFHAMRAAYWYHEERKTPVSEVKTPESPNPS